MEQSFNNLKNCFNSKTSEMASIADDIFLPSGQQASCCSGLLGSGSGSTNDTTHIKDL